ncbi:hypothetical protein [Pseudomonas sp.]|uniref:hypothetical protein n=1 Tax=Pseudomonas sp. TaxID=306 RepID=UPI003BB761EF
MAKPPKKIPGSPSSEVPTASTRSSQDDFRQTLGDVGHPLSTGTDPLAATPSAAALPRTIEPNVSVIVSQMPDSHNPSSARDTVTAAATQDTSLNTRTPAIDEAVSDRPARPVFIDAEAANRLKSTAVTPEGIRYDKHKKAYVEMADGMVMVRKGADGYQQTHAHESSPSGAWVEQIPGTQLWRQRPPTDSGKKRPAVQRDPLSDDSPEVIEIVNKRPRLAPDDDATAPAESLLVNLLTQQNSALDLSAGHWKNWGRTTRPARGESIEIDAKHYLIVPQGLRPDTGLVYLQHPGFAPDHFDAFEQMLRHEPARQPKWALKRDDQWRVLDNHLPFEMSPSQYVASAFRYLSDVSAHAIARSVFNQVRRPDTLDAHGLSLMALIFRNWKDRLIGGIPRHSLADPLVMLPKLPTQPDNLLDGGLLPLPPRGSPTLQRLDFDPQRFPVEWAPYAATPTGASLRNMFTAVLFHEGYRIHPVTRQHQEGALIFHRPGVAAIFVLKLPRISGDSVPRNTLPGSELTRADFQNRLTASGKKTLNNALAKNQVIYLVGGVQQSATETPTLFMVREG